MSLVGLGARASTWRRSIVFVALLILALPASAVAEPYALQIVTDDPASADATDHAWVEAESRDGARVVFTTTAAMAPSDTDTAFDLYARVEGGAPLHLTDTPAGPDGTDAASFEGASADARHLYFETFEPLLATDTDDAEDLYARTPSGDLIHVSDRPVGPDGPDNTELMAVSDDGLRAVFRTVESLAATDGDTQRDIYELGPDGLRHLSEDPFGIDQSAPANFKYASPDGARVYFSTEQSLAMSDEDGAEDVYMRGADGSLVHVSDDGNNPDPDRHAYFAGEAAGGGRVWLETDESLAASDTDISVDVYERAPSGALAHVSDGSPGPDALRDVHLRGRSADGSRLVIETSEQFSATDTDPAQDVYRREADGSFVHLSDGPGEPDGSFGAYFEGVSDDGSTLAFVTAEPLAPSDTDTVGDVYLRVAGGALVHVSDDRTGPDDAVEASFIASSKDGSKVLVQSAESLVAGDDDGKDDLFLWAGGELVNLSDDPGGPDAELPAYPRTLSADLSRVYLWTEEQLAADDTDATGDGYVAFPAPAPPAPPTVPSQPSSVQPGDTTAPLLSGLRVLPKALARSKPAIRFSLSEPARVEFTVRRGKRAVGRFARAAAAGASRLRFPDAVARRLIGGKLVLRAVPRDAAGNLGALRRAHFSSAPHRV